MTSDANALTANYIGQQKQRLMDLVAELRDDNRASAKEEAKLQTNSLHESEGSGDDAQKTNLRDNDAALIEHNAARIDTIRRALEKIEDGTYGVSDRSGKPIPKERLDALPESLWTVDEDDQA